MTSGGPPTSGAEHAVQCSHHPPPTLTVTALLDRVVNCQTPLVTAPVRIMLHELGKREASGIQDGDLGSEYPVWNGVLSACTAVAWAFAIELNITIFLTFRRRGGLYFWSLLVSSWGCMAHALAFVLKFQVGAPIALYLPFIEIGWVAMVTGQACVLYSRLHLVVRKSRTLHWVLAMILVNVCVLHVPTIILNVGSNAGDPDVWVHPFGIMERIQLAMFCLQEFIISTVYIVSTVRILGSVYHSLTRKVMWELIIINAICIGMDVILIGLEYSNQYIGEASLKPTIYVIKLKIEFVVLNQLVGITKAGLTDGNKYTGGASHHSHELRNRTLLSANHDVHRALPKNDGTWANATATHGALAGDPIADPKLAGTEIFKTQQVDVVREAPGPPDLRQQPDSTSSSATAVADRKPLPKAASLMGTSIVMAPPRTNAWTSVNHPRAPSPSESTREIVRGSTDEEKGTRWLEGSR